MIELADRVKARGYRLTAPRRAVLEVLARERAHLTPEELYRRARRRYPKIGLVTVYRTLALLERAGLVERVHVEAHCKSFALVRLVGAHHHRLICRDCGRVEEFSDCALESTLKSLQKRTGFAIESHQVEVIGRCPECQ
jgi:Fur family ferric uptake transcriptional regulator